jgi:hypothetical protein
MVSKVQPSSDNMAQKIDSMLEKNSVSGLIPFLGLGCLISSIFLEFPEACCGAKGSTICVCLESGLCNMFEKLYRNVFNLNIPITILINSKVFASTAYSQN